MPTPSTSAATVTVAADTTPPEVESVTVPISGAEVELVFDEDLDETVVDTLLTSVFSLTVAGQAVTIRDQEIRATVLALYVQAGTIKQGQTVVVSYTDPTAGDDTVALQDIAGNDVASFTTGMSGVPAVTNDSTVTPNTPAMGAPTITGTAQVGQTLTAVTTGITDADGLTSPTYTYQWIRANGTEADIASANSSTYTWSRRPGQDHQGQGELHRRRQQCRDADQRGDGDGGSGPDGPDGERCGRHLDRRPRATPTGPGEIDPVTR